MYLLYGGPGNANLAPHAALQEAGLTEGTDYRFVKLDLKAGEHRKPDYLALNPHGVVPTLVIGKDGNKQVVCESAAILMHIADLFPAAGLAPTPGSPGRAAWYQWIAYLTNTVQARFMNFYHADYFIDGAAGQAAVKAKADTALKEQFAHIDSHLGRRGAARCAAHWCVDADGGAARQARALAGGGPGRAAHAAVGHADDLGEPHPRRLVGERGGRTGASDPRGQQGPGAGGPAGARRAARAPRAARRGGARRPAGARCTARGSSRAACVPQGVDASA